MLYSLVHGADQEFLPRFFNTHQNTHAGRTYIAMGKMNIRGFGLLGEQGAECPSMCKFNCLQQTYQSVHELVTQLTLIIKEPLLSVAPQNVAVIHPPKN